MVKRAIDLGSDFGPANEPVVRRTTRQEIERRYTLKEIEFREEWLERNARFVPNPLQRQGVQHPSQRGQSRTHACRDCGIVTHDFNASGECRQCSRRRYGVVWSY